MRSLIVFLSFILSYPTYAALDAIKLDHNFIISEDDIHTDKLHYGLKTFRVDGSEWQNSDYSQAWPGVENDTQLVTFTKVGFLLEYPINVFTEERLFDFERLVSGYPDNEFSLVESYDSFVYYYIYPVPLIGPLSGRVSNVLIHSEAEQVVIDAVKIPLWLQNKPNQKFIYQVGTNFNKFFSTSKAYMQFFDMGNGTTYILSYGIVGLKRRNRILSMFLRMAVAQELRNYKEGFLKTFEDE